MHASTALLLVAAGFAAAQTSSAASSTASSASVSGCGSQIDTIIASCIATEMAQYNACATNDWGCMCTQITNVLTCYNNCPGDPARNGVLQQQTSYCNAASAYPSSTSATATGTMTGSTMSTAASTTSGSVDEASVSSTTSATASAASETKTGAAVANVVAYPGLVAAFFGLAALL